MARKYCFAYLFLVGMVLVVMREWQTYNRLGDSGVLELVEGLKSNSSLQILDLVSGVYFLNCCVAVCRAVDGGNTSCAERQSRFNRGAMSRRGMYPAQLPADHSVLRPPALSLHLS